MSRKGWESLSPTYRQRLERHGITREAYESTASLSQARGHPRRGERLVREQQAVGRARHREVRPASDDRIVAAVQRMAGGESLQRAAKAEHVSPERLRRVAHERGYIGKVYRTSASGREVFDWQVSSGAVLPVLEADGTYHEAVSFDLHNAIVVGEWWQAEQQLERGRAEPLVRLGSITVTDVDGQTYALMTDPNAVLASLQAMTDEERMHFGRIYGSEQVVARRG